MNALQKLIEVVTTARFADKFLELDRELDAEGAAGTKQGVRQLVANEIAEKYGHPVLPANNETFAVAPSSPKTAALVFDRVWYPPSGMEDIPNDIAAYGATEFEICLLALTELFAPLPDGASRAADAMHGTSFAGRAMKLNALERDIAECIREELSVAAVPMYSSVEDRDLQYQPGDRAVIVAAVDRMQLVDENQLTWAQVRQFREDKASQKALHRMMHWLDAELVGKPLSFIVDEISSREEDYRETLRKHGVLTVIGTLESVVDPKLLAGLGALTAGLGMTGHGASAVLASIGIVGAKSAFTLARGLLDLREARRGVGAEVSFVHQVREQLS